MSEPDEQRSPGSFYTSPEEARHAPPEDFLYLACLHEGTGVRAPDFLAVVDAQDGRIVHETPMPNVGDELHHFGWKDRKSTRLNSSHLGISYAVFCLKKKNEQRKVSKKH